MDKMKVSAYVRESSDDTNKSPPIENQIKVFDQWVKENNHETIEVYSDNGFSGGDWKRPAWNKCVRDAKRHHYQVLWVWDQDRLARDTEQFLWFYRHINKAKVKIFEHTSNDFIDMESLGGRVKHQSLAQASEIFRLVTSDKVKRTYENKKKLSIKNNTPLSWGREKVEFDIDLARKFRDEGKGWREIAKCMGTYEHKRKSDGKVTIKNYNYQTIRRVLLNTHKEI